MTDPQQTAPAPGWYPDATGSMRWWDGRMWTEHVHQVGQQQMQQPVIVNAGRPVRYYKTSHGFHLVMSLVTLGLWLPVWGIMSIANSSRSN